MRHFQPRELPEFHQMTRGGVYWELLVVCLLTFTLCFTNS